MEFSKLIEKAKTIQEAYRLQNQIKNENLWGAAEYLQGLVGDVGDLAKLIMAKNHFRSGENITQNLSHELADCLWSIIILSEELDINLEQAFLDTMNDLELKIKQSSRE